MRLLLSFWSFCIVPFTITKALLSLDINEESAPFDPNDPDSLFPANSIPLSTDLEDSGLESVSILDDLYPFALEDSGDQEWADSVELAKSNDFCEIADEGQYLSRMRARGTANSCSFSDQPVNFLNLPDPSDLFSLEGSTKKPDTEPLIPAPVFTEPNKDQGRCRGSYPTHLCCGIIDWSSLQSFSGLRVYGFARGCISGTWLTDHSWWDSQLMNAQQINLDHVWHMKFVANSSRGYEKFSTDVDFDGFNMKIA